MTFYKTGASIVILLLASLQITAAGQPSKAQKQCVLSLQAAGASVALTASKATIACVSKKNHDKTTAFDLANCLGAIESQVLQRAKDKTVAVAEKNCKEIPSFGPANAQDVNAAFAKSVDLSKIFGDDINAKVQSSKVDAKTANCQLVLAEQLASLVRTEIAEYGSCSKKLFSKGTATTVSDIQACAEQQSKTLLKAKVAAYKRIEAKCALDSSSMVASGQCADSASTSELATCLAAQAHCDASIALNKSNRIDASGHQFKDGVATFYCGSKPAQSQSVARQWNDVNLSAIRIDNPRPPVHARNLFHLSAAMYDAWAVYDMKAKPYSTAERINSSDKQHDREIAISFAAYRILAERYSKQHSLGSVVSEASFNKQMNILGLDKNYADITGDAPAAVGNRIAHSILTEAMSDGSNEASDYADPSYQPVNSPLIVKEPGFEITDSFDPNRWQPLALDKTVTQNGITLPDKVQTSIGSQWGSVKPFAITKSASTELYLDPGPQPLLGGLGDAQFKAEVVQLIELASQLTPDDQTVVDISPASFGHNQLASNAGTGYEKNPITGQPYVPQLVKRGDFGRVLAEWWADGPTSETPPGHWNAIANHVADTPGFERRFKGSGSTLDPLEWDVKTYFALNGATHDAAIAAWGAKRKYDGVRPITMVRYMAKQGQSSDPAKPHYHAHGLPLKPGLVELITAESSAAGQRHAALVAAGAKINDIALYSWPGAPANQKADYSGVKWILGTDWVPYQRPTFVTPAFPGYISGHSTFSRAAAEVLAAITGSEYFPGGLYEYAIPKDTYLIHEHGPSQDVKLQWASYFDASDQSGRSRLWGGIHPEADDFAGRKVGHQAGMAAFTKAVSYFESK